MIQRYEQKQYIHKVNPDTEMTPKGRVWLLPHFPLCRPDRKTMKTRIAFDASARDVLANSNPSGRTFVPVEESTE